VTHEAYSKLAIHRWMLQDEIRNEAYRRAIAQTVRPGHVVLDMGAGTGFLSILAAQAGARKVYAVERTSIAGVARRMVKRNGMEDRVDVLQANLEDVDLPEKVDVIVSEWMGGLGVDENMLAPLVMARDRWLNRGGTIIPERVTAFLAPAWIASLAEDWQHWRTRPHGVDMSVVAELCADDPLMFHGPVAPTDLLARPQQLWTHDAYRCSLGEADRSFESKLAFESERAGKLTNLVAWFHAELCRGQSLTNAVGAPRTHWGRLVYPLADAIDVRAGERIGVEFRCEPTAPGSCEFYWAVRVGQLPAEEHDSRRR
jgi:type I protein arginine methyltransferase